MTVTVNNFRQHFPEFTDTEKFLDTTIIYWLTLALKLLNVDRWGDLLDNGAELFVAHNIALEAKALQEGSTGGIPGSSTGLLSSKSVDRVSISYDTSSSLEDGAGHWNLTIYGKRYIRLARLVGMGPIHVGTGDIVQSVGPAWPGPQL